MYICDYIKFSLCMNANNAHTLLKLNVIYCLLYILFHLVNNTANLYNIKPGYKLNRLNVANIRRL